MKPFVGLIYLLLSCLPMTVLGQKEVSPWTDPAWSFDSKKIAYASHDGNDWEIFIVDTQTKEVTQLTDNSSDESSPAWSPDGSKIIMESNQDGNVEIYTVEISGGAQERLTNHPSQDSEPVYSPHGDLIAFTSHRNGDPQIFLMNLNGRILNQITIQGRNEMAMWSKDGQRLTYHSNWAGHWEIFIIDKDGKNLWSPTHHADEPVFQKWNTTDGKYIGVPDFSPDGDQVVFHHSPDRSNWGIYKTNLATKEIEALVDTADHEVFPSWSPDGKLIAFQSTKEGQRGLYVIKPDGYGQQFLVGLQYPKSKSN